MYTSSMEVRANKIRNKKEYRYDGYDWRSCTEEWVTLSSTMSRLLALLLLVLGNAAAFAPTLASRSMVAARAPAVSMSRICDITGKRANNANRVTFSNHHNQRWQQVNLQTKRFFSPELNREVRLKVATSTLRTIRKLGLDETAKKYGVDLSKF